jgi:chloride channel protein, CIC family
LGGGPGARRPHVADWDRTETNPVLAVLWSWQCRFIEVPESRENQGSVLVLALVSCATGALTGLLVAVFRLSLEQGDLWRDGLISRAHGWSVAGFLLTVGSVAAAAAGAVWMVRRFSPYAAGSGIPHVEAVARGDLPPAPFSLIPVKFIGGLLAIGGGLALGREGPSVQMGADIGVFVGKMLGLTERDCMALLAACGGAGIATAFNAPIAGAVFVLEELVRRFDTRIAIAALGSSCFAIAVARLFLGRTPDFHVEPLPFSGLGSGFLFLLLGAVAGLLGMAYHHALLGSIALVNRIHWPVELRAAVIGGLVGAVAWFAPGLVGGGDPITRQMLSKGESVTLLPFLFGLRFLLGPLSYAAGTPGGLFAPMLVLGTQLGLLFAALCGFAFPHLVVAPTAFAVVAMAAFFTAVVRAPVTGIILVIELTASFTQLMPMLWACFGAMVIPTFFGTPPIYESLRQPALQEERGGGDVPAEKSIQKLPRS